jgi:hypothetical protein
MCLQATVNDEAILKKFNLFSAISIDEGFCANCLPLYDSLQVFIGFHCFLKNFSVTLL